MKRKLLSILALLCLTVSSAWADWDGKTYTATADETFSEKTITVSDDATLTINPGVTVTLYGGGIVVTDGKTLTITGGGKLVVWGLYGGDGDFRPEGSTGDNGGNAIEGNVTILGATVEAYGGMGGMGGEGGTGGKGGNGGNGGAAFTGVVTIYSGNIAANGGPGGYGGKGGQGAAGAPGGGQGGNGGDGGDSGNGGVAFTGSLCVFGGIVSATGGDRGEYGGAGGYGGIGDGWAAAAGNPGQYGNYGVPGKAFTNDVTINATEYTMVGGESSSNTSTITTATEDYYVNITATDIVASGTCGTTGHESDVIWTLAGTTGNYTLTIKKVGATGAMMDYDKSLNQPWHSHKEDITKVVIGDGVTSIGNNAFNYIYHLPSVTIPASVTSIGNCSFGYCYDLTSVTFATGSQLTKIDSNAFYACNSLIYITIPANVTSIGSSAFWGCTKVTDVYCYADPKKLTWSYENYYPDFYYDSEHPSEKTKCHVTNADAWGGFLNVNVSFVGDLLGTAPLTANAAEGYNWATYYNSSEQNIKVGEGTQVFKVKLTDSELELTEITDGIINAEQAVLLKSTTNVNFLTAESASVISYEDNSLVGTTTSITNPGNAYVLGYKEGTGVGFYKLKSGGTIGANKAYLVYTGTGAPEFFGFGNATGVSTLNVERGTLNGEVYNLNGQRVEHPTKGLYIVNGKKVVIK